MKAVGYHARRPGADGFVFDLQPLAGGLKFLRRPHDDRFIRAAAGRAVLAVGVHGGETDLCKRWRGRRFGTRGRERDKGDEAGDWQKQAFHAEDVVAGWTGLARHKLQNLPHTISAIFP